MSWIPLVGGSLGATFGGFIADHVVKDRGSWARILVLVGSQIIAAPFAAGKCRCCELYAVFLFSLLDRMGLV